MSESKPCGCKDKPVTVTGAFALPVTLDCGCVEISGLTRYTVNLEDEQIIFESRCELLVPCDACITYNPNPNIKEN